MTAAELSAWVDKQGAVNYDGLLVAVRVVDARSVFGRVDLQVVPLQGSGSAWVESSRLKTTKGEV